MPSWIDFKELRSKLKFEDVLAHYGVEVKRRGEQHLGFCPLPGHKGKRNSPKPLPLRNPVSYQLPVEARKRAIVHVEDDPLWGEVIEKIIGEMECVRYAGIGRTAADGLALCESVKPAIILLDLRLPDRDGMEIVNALSAARNPPMILFITVRLDDFVLYYLRRPPVMGMIWKNIYVRSSLPDAIARLLNGARYLPPEVQSAEQAFYSHPAAFFKILSDREIELVRLFGRGDSDIEVAERLGIQRSTAKSHREHILAKLGLHSSQKLTRWAVQHGFVDFDCRSA